MFKLAITPKKKKKKIKKLYSLDSFAIFDSLRKVNKNKVWSTTKLSIKVKNGKMCTCTLYS